MVYDYSNLLKAIDNAQLEEKKLKNHIIANKKDELAELEMEIQQSGVLDDWYQLNEALRKLNIRGFAYPGTHSLADKFTDGFKFMETMSSGSHWHDQYGISINGITGNNGIKKFRWVITHCGGQLWDGFETWGGDYEAKEINFKIRMLKEFKKAYPIYREFKLKEVYAALGKQIETNEQLKTQL